MSQDQETLTRTGALMGSVPFMAPELRRGEAHTEASDRYALAATLAWSATGSFPPDLDRAGALDALPEAVADFIVELLAGDVRVTGADRVRSRRMRRWTRAALVLAGMGLAAAAGWGLRPAPPPPAEADPEPPGVLATYEALPLCDAALSFVAWDKYPHYDFDPRLPEEGGGVSLLDIDGDGDLDLVVTYVLGLAVDVFLNKDGGFFRRDDELRMEAPLRFETDVAYSTLVTGDLEGDGRADALWLKRNRMGGRVLGTDVDGALAIEAIPLGDPSATPVLVDIDGDGCDDLLYASMTVPPRLTVRRSRCDGSLDVAATYLEGWSGVAREDRHIVAQHADGRLGILNPARAEVTPITSPPGLKLELWRGSGIQIAGLSTDTMLSVGLRDDATLCRAPAAKTHHSLAAVGDIDLDGVVDRVVLKTCGYCTSQVNLERGVRN